jgi:hypothetical protein
MLGSTGGDSDWEGLRRKLILLLLLDEVTEIEGEG